MTFEVTMLDQEAPVVISSQTLNRQDGKDEYYVRAAAMGDGVDPRRADGVREPSADPADALVAWRTGSCWAIAAPTPDDSRGRRRS